MPFSRNLLFCLLFLSHASWSQTIDHQQLQNADIQRQLPEHEYQMLSTGQGIEFPVILDSHTSANNRGLAVLVNDVSEAPLDQSALAPLTSYLNALGWDTLLLSPPKTDLFIIPPESSEGEASETEQQEPTDEQSTGSGPRPYELASGIQPAAAEQHLERLTALMQAVEQQQQNARGYQLVIAKGTSAAWLLQQYNEGQLTPPDGLVLLAPFWPEPDMNHQVPKLIGSNRLPLLDVFTPWDNNWAGQTVERRRQAALQAFQPDYRQRQLIGPPLSNSQYAYMSKEIYGWLTSMGW